MKKLPEYRKFLTLTDEEITFICKNILNMKKVSHIERYDDYISVDVVDSFVDEEDGVFCTIEDNIDLYENGIATYSFQLAKEESEQYKKYLFSLGICWLLDNNPYI